MGNLPAELKLEILQRAATDSLHSMLAIASSTSSFRKIFIDNEKSLLAKVFTSLLPRHEAAVILTVASIPHPLVLSEEKCLAFFSNTAPLPLDPFSIKSFESIALARYAVKLGTTAKKYRALFVDRLGHFFNSTPPYFGDNVCKDPQRYMIAFFYAAIHERCYRLIHAGWGILGPMRYEEGMDWEGMHTETDAREQTADIWLNNFRDAINSLGGHTEQKDAIKELLGVLCFFSYWHYSDLELEDPDYHRMRMLQKKISMMEIKEERELIGGHGIENSRNSTIVTVRTIEPG